MLLRFLAIYLIIFALSLVANVKKNRMDSPPGQPYEVVTIYRGFKVILYDGMYLAFLNVRRGFDFFIFKHKAYPQQVSGSSLKEVLKKVDRQFPSN